MLKEIDEIDLLIEEDEILAHKSFVKGIRIMDGSDEDKSDNAIKLPEVNDS